MSDELREHWLGETSEDGFEVWPDNWRSVTLFCFCSTQWLRADSGLRLGLNYAAVQAVFTMHRIPARHHTRLMFDIRLMEFGALEAMAEQAEQSNGAGI